MNLLGKVFNMRTMGVLLLLFGITIGVATFIENDFGTLSAKAVIYNARWFEVMLGLLVVNMIVVIFTHKMYRKEKIVNLVFHLAFILILIGAGITRFIGYEGVMHIREGESSNTFISENAYVSVWINDGDDRIESDQRVLFSPLSGADYKKSFTLNNGSDIDVEIVDFTPHAQYEVVDDPNGGAVATIVTTVQGERSNEFLVEGRPRNIGGLLFSLNNPETEGYVHIVESDSGLMMKSPMPGRFMRMADQSFGDVPPGEWVNFVPMQLYVIGNSNFVLSEFRANARLQVVSSGDVNSGLADVVKFKISKGDQERTVNVGGGRGIRQREGTVNLDGTNVSVAYGSLMLQLPFSIELKDFQLERYPGSESPSSFASEVVLKDPSQGVNQPYRIFMNNILEHRGFRFYQSSYDRDEGGTVLSVNNDYWGTFVTYWGYFFLFLGLILIFFSRNTRFAQLSKMISSLHTRRATGATMLLIFALLVPYGANAQEEELPAPTPEHAEYFSSILYQTDDGRITPLNTVSSEILRKVVKKASYKGFTPDQVFLGMISHPEAWRDEDMIRVNHSELSQILGAEGKYASFLDFFTQEGEYKIKSLVEEAFAKKPAERNKLDKELIAVDERINICYMAYFGSFLKVFPVPGHPDNKWISPMEPSGALSREDSLFIKGVIPLYFSLLEEGLNNGNYQEADKLVQSIKRYQEKFGAEVMPPEGKVRMEILYNKVNIFERLYPYYMLVGFAFLVMIYIRILNPKREMKWGFRIVQWLVIGGFALHAIGLGMRWYISGHEPWSNGYESMLYIAWAGLLAGLIFRKKSPMTMAVTAILAGIILFVAHLSWMDPEITNLVPVLKSYWLTIHVATITASYGFLALGALLAFVNLVSMIMRRVGNRDRLNLTIKESSYVIEMTLTVGLVLLTIGNFLGGIWANESWGRYWGWDPKETWALATIIFYAFILHMRFIPGLRGLYAFNLASLVGFSSVLMTYFGVNFYLSGLHSYAKGDPLPIPNWVYYTVGVIFIIAALAFINERFSGKDKDQKGEKEVKSNGKGKKEDALLEVADV